MLLLGVDEIELLLLFTTLLEVFNELLLGLEVGGDERILLFVEGFTPNDLLLFWVLFVFVDKFWILLLLLLLLLCCETLTY